MALSKIDVANMVTGAVPVANGGTALTSGFVNGADPRPLSKPLIINGNMAVNQRGSLNLSNPGDGVYTLDRWECQKNHDGAITVSQEALTSGNAYNDGFKTALKCDITTVDTSLASGQKFFIQQIIEAQNLQVLKFGTSSAEKLTLSFWIKATKTGTNVVRMYAYDDDRSCSIAYTISSSNTWEKKILNFPADTTGVIDNNNGHGIQISWALMAASNFQSGTLATSWAANSSANDFVGQVNHMDSTSNTWHITGVQLEVGEFSSATIPPYQHESFVDNLRRCERYYQTPIYANDHYGTSEQYAVFGLGTYTASGFFRCVRPLPVEMRANPSLVSNSGTNYFFIGSGGNDYVNDLTIHTDSNYKTAFVYNNDEASGTAGQAGNLMGDNTAAYAHLDAEL